MTAGVSGIPWGSFGTRRPLRCLSSDGGTGQPGEETDEVLSPEVLERRLAGDHVPHRSRSFRQTSRVTESFPQRLVLLAAIALLAAVSVLAIIDRRAPVVGSTGLTSAPAPAGWNTAFAGSRGAVGDAQRTTCGQVLAPESLGVTHPVLPCGAKVVLRNGDLNILTEVIDNALVEPGRQLEVTEELASMLGIEGTIEIEWRFATEPGR